MSAIQISEARKLNGLREARASRVRKLKGLKNISWLTARQLNKLAGALSVNGVERNRQVIVNRDRMESLESFLSQTPSHLDGDSSWA
jgi:hypothetical protein